MKKSVLFLVFSLVFIFSSFAQKEPFANNFFVGAGVNGNVYLYDKAWENSDVWKNPTIGGELFLGKWFNSKWGARLALEGGTAKTIVDKNETLIKQNFGLARLDLMLNLTNLFRSYSPDRFYNLIPHVGAGGAYSFDPSPANAREDGKDNYFSYLFGGGLLNTFRFSNVVSLYVDLKMNFVDTKFDGFSEKNINGIVSPSIGFIFNLGVGKAAPVVAPVVIEEVNNYITERKEETPPPPPPAPAPKPVEPKTEAPVVVAPAPFPYNVFFRIGRSVVDADQQANISNTAKYMNENPTTKVKIVGYADKGTGSAALNMRLSEQRAKNVAKQLVEKYKISSDRISVDWKGDTVQPFDVNAKNRVAIILGN